jgi:hypothetical protein
MLHHSEFDSIKLGNHANLLKEKTMYIRELL